jgi:hypothetical protein
MIPTQKWISSVSLHPRKLKGEKPAFVRPFVRSFVRSFVPSFVRSFVCSFVRPVVCLRNAITEPKKKKEYQKRITKLAVWTPRRNKKNPWQKLFRSRTNAIKKLLMGNIREIILKIWLLTFVDAIKAVLILISFSKFSFILGTIY